MFKPFLLLLIIILNISVLEASYYERGKKYFYNKEYKKAIIYFKEAKDNYSNMDMLIMWAYSEKALGRELYLIAAYERILNLNPNNFDIAMKLNRLYKNRDLEGKVANTIEKFNYNDFENSYRGYISKFLHHDNKKLKKLHSNYYATINSDQAMHVYDQNNSLKVLDYPLKTDTHYNLGANYSYIHDLDNKGLFFKADAKLCVDLKSDSSLISRSLLKIDTEIGKKISEMIFAVPLSYSYNTIKNHYKYDIVKLSPKIIILLDESHIFDFSFIYSKTSFLDQQMNELNSDTYGLTSTMRYMMDHNNLHLGMTYLKTDSLYSKKRYKIFLSNFMPVKDFNINFKANFILDEYKSEISNRRDRILDIATEFYTKPINNTRFLYKINYLSNDTNYKGLNYDKLIFSFGLEFNS